MSFMRKCLVLGPLLLSVVPLLLVSMIDACYIYAVKRGNEMGRSGLFYVQHFGAYDVFLLYADVNIVA